MTPVFVDAYYWMAYLNPRDQNHARVMSLSIPWGLITSVPVLIEIMDGLSHPQLRSIAARFWNECHANEDLTIIPTGPDELGKAAALYARRPDKAWSLTDCVSFNIMAERGIRLALTGDHHFIQAGFEIAFP